MRHGYLLGVISVIWLINSCSTGPKPSSLEKRDSAITETTVAVIPTRADSNVVTAQKNLEADSSEENFIWYGRRLGYANQMNDAIDVFSAGIIRFPKSYKLYRHRGHRYISTRQFSLAVIDLEKAVKLIKGNSLEIEPDGIPNKLNKPLSTVQFNIWYHLGLSYYLLGDLGRAENAFEECLKISNNDDLLVATVDWLYMTYKRMNDQKAAKNILLKIKDNLNIIENDAYYKRLRMYKGELPVDSLLQVKQGTKDNDLNLATQGYGVGNWYYYSGYPDKAKEIFRKITEGPSLYSFGYIAAETDLKRLWR